MPDENPLFAPFAPPSTGDSMLSGSGAPPPPSGSVPGSPASYPGVPAPPAAGPGPYQPGPYPPGPYQPDPGYWAPPGNVYTPPPSGPNGTSIAALVTALLGLGIIPVVLGIVGLSTTPRGGQGRVFAILGIVLGGIESVLWAVLVGAILLSPSDGPYQPTPFGDDPYSYGDDAQLDRLYDSCEEGSMEACDDLYDESPYDSEYEWFGWTCGERSDSDQWCTEQGLTDEDVQV